MDNLPGFPDNINLASDGNYWLAMVGMRSPGARSRLADARLPPAHGQARADRRMAVPQHQHRLRASSSTSAARCWRSLLGPARRQPSHDHLDARAPRLSLSRRHHEQPHRPIQDSPTPIPTSSSTTGAGGSAHDRRAEGIWPTACSAAATATITVPSFDGALKPNQILEKAETVAELEAPEDLATDGKVALHRRRCRRPAATMAARRP